MEPIRPKKEGDVNIFPLKNIADAHPTIRKNSTILSEHLAAAATQEPPKNIALLPSWIQKDFAHFPYLNLSSSSTPDSFRGLKKIIEHPISLHSTEASQEPNIQICMKLRIKHVPLTGEDTTTKEFPLFAVIKLGNSNDWLLISETGDLLHQEESVSFGEILPDYTYTALQGESIDPALIQTFIDTENQDDLPKEHRFHLAWLLLRLIHKGHLLLREKDRPMVLSFEKPAVGYWKISLDQK